jgi:hypothetical protein
MINTMKLFYQALESLSDHSDEMISVFDLVKVIDLRLQRLEDQLGIPLPDDLTLIKKKFPSEYCIKHILIRHPQMGICNCSKCKEVSHEVKP